MTSAIDDRPKISERYAIAIESGDLKPSRSGVGDLEILMAAGMARDYDGNSLALGTALARLRTEFDSVKASLLQGKTASRIDQYLILSELNSLAEVKRLLGALAIIQATKRKLMKPDVVALTLAGRALDVWLSPICYKCDGVGQIGGYGRPQQICPSCGGSGHRKSRIGHDEEEAQFAGFLICELDRLVNQVDVNMRRKLGWMPSEA